MSNRVFIALGSNLGDRKRQLMQAVSLLAPPVKVSEESSIYETAPWGFIDQPAFLNMVVVGKTELTPKQLLSHLKSIEEQVGRKTTFRFGPRIIDLDILFYDDLILNSTELVIPHPQLNERAFVLVPLAELDSEFIHPISGKTILQLLAIVDASTVQLYSEK